MKGRETARPSGRCLETRLRLLLLLNFSFLSGFLELRSELCSPAGGDLGGRTMQWDISVCSYVCCVSSLQTMERRRGWCCSVCGLTA